jgi:ABC-2 type transport system permease protein
MQVFKAYFQVMKKHLMLIMIYLIVFVVLSAIISGIISGQSAPASFFETKYNIALFNDDGNAPLAQGLKQYIENNAQLVEIGGGEQEIQDALFYGRADCVVTIPQGFAEDFMNGNSPQIENMAAAGMPASVYMDFMVNKYLNMAALYAKSMPGATQADIADYVVADLEKTAAVDFRQTAAPAPPSPITYYFQMLAYSLLAAMMMGVSLVMMSFNEVNVNNRTICAPLKPVRMNMQMVLANVVFALVVWAVMCAFTLVSNDVKLDAGVALLCLNALVFTLVSLCIGFLMGKFVKNHGVQAAVTNVVSLGMSFISGVFVEQALLGKTVQTIGSFTPTYWYIRVVDAIRVMAAVNAESIKPVIEGMLIQLGFAAAILIVTLAISKQRRKAAV